MAFNSIFQKNITNISFNGKAHLRFARFPIVFLLFWFYAALPLSAQINTDNVTIMGRNALAVDDYVTAIHYFNQVIEAKPHLYEPYYFRAYAKFSLEDYIGAEADCSRALQLNPYMGDIYQLRGLCRIHNEDFEGAVSDYTYTLKENPDDQGAMYNRALCRLELKDLKTADQELDLLLSKWKNFQRAYLVKAQIAMEMKDTVSSLTWVDSLIKVNPRSEQAWSFKGRYALSKENFQLADSCLSEAIQLNPTGYENYIVRAQARHGMSRFSQALHDYDHAIDLVPEHFIAHYNRGLLRALVGDKNRAIEDFNFILKVEPDNTLAQYNRALLREETGDYKGAIADYSALIRVYPNFTYGYMARANCRRKTGDINGAIKDESFVAKAQLDMKYKPHQRRPIKKVRQRSDHSLDQYQQLVEETPDTTRRYVNQLMGKVQNRKVEQTPLPAFTFALRTANKEANLQTPAFLPEMDRINRMQLLPVAVTFEATNERMRTIDELESGLLLLNRTTINNAEIHFLKSIVHTALYNYDEALIEIQSAIRIDSSNYVYPLHCANIHVAMHQSKPKSVTLQKEVATTAINKAPRPQHLQLAMHYLNKALSLTPQNAYLLFNRGNLYALMQQEEAALRDYNTAISIDPHLAEVRYNRAILHLRSGQVDEAIPDLSRAGQDGLYKAYNLLKQATQLKSAAKKEQEKKERLKEIQKEEE